MKREEVALALLVAIIRREGLDICNGGYGLDFGEGICDDVYRLADEFLRTRGATTVVDDHGKSRVVDNGGKEIA